MTTPTSSSGSDVRRLRTLELWVGAALVLIALVVVGTLGAMLTDVFASGRSTAPVAPAATTIAAPAVPPTAAPTQAAAPTQDTAPAAATSGAVTPPANSEATAAALATEVPATASPAAPAATTPTTAPNAATVLDPAPRPAALPTTAPVNRPAPAAVSADPAPSAAEVARRRCAALDSYIAELRAQNAGGGAPWVSEQLQTALGRRAELGC